jgi:PAS domain S-box-containing protein
MPEQTTFEGLLEAVPDALIGVDPSGAIRFVNHQAELLFGYDHDELVGQPLETLVPESLRKTHAAQRESYFSDPLTRALGSGLDLSGRHRDGTEIPVDISLSHLDTVDGPLVIASVRDMTERKKAEAGRLGAERMSAVVEFSGEAILSSTLDGIVTSYNRAAEKVFGYTEDEIVGKSGSLLSPKDRADEASAILATIRTGQPVMNFETIRVRKDGTAFPVSLTVSPIFDYGGTVVGASAIPRDITSQKHAFDAAQHMAAIIENSDDAIIGKTLDGIITSWNPAAERMFGYSSNEILGKPIGLLSPEDRPHEMTAILTKIRAGQAVERLETTRLRKDLTAFTVSLTVSPIHDPNGAIVGASTITRDVTKQRQAFEAARSMIESSLDSLVSISPEGMITDVNEATVKVTGIPREELIGTAFSDYFTEPEKANEIYQRVFAEGMAVDYPLTMRHRDGSLTDVLYNAAVQRDTGGNVLGVFAAARDVTEARQAFESARSMIESSLDSLVAISPEGMITDANEATVTVTGIPREELIGTAFSDYFTDPKKANAIYQLVFEKGMAVDYPLTMRHRDGSLTDVLYNAAVYRDTGGKVLGVFAAARDVTEARQAFESARSMIESSLDSLVAISPEGMITDANEATAKVTGIPREELIGTAFSDYFTDPKKANAIYQLVFEKGMAVDYPLTMRHPDGSLTDVLYNASVYRDAGGKVLGVFAAARDVTKQRQAGAQYARSLIEAGLDPLVAISPEGKITDVNEATVTVTGIPREELIGTAFSDYFTEPDKANEGYQRAFAQGSVTDYPLTIRRPNGTLSEVLYNASVYRDEAGDVLGVFAAARDVTEQKLAQSELAKQAKELNRLAELERFQRLTVGRELKMIELKKEIESLRRLVQTDGGELGDQL